MTNNEHNNWRTEPFEIVNILLDSNFIIIIIIAILSVESAFCAPKQKIRRKNLLKWKLVMESNDNDWPFSLFYFNYNLMLKRLTLAKEIK